MSKQPKYVFVSWCPHDALQGMESLEPMEELAYRRILDFIYTHKDQLPDEDRRLARMTKTGSRWPKIKASLVRLGKLQVENGRLTNGRCQRELAAVEHRISEAKRAAETRWRARKQLEGNKTGDADAHASAMLTHKPIPSLQEGRPPAGEYAFDGRVIRLTAKDLALWKRSAPDVDVMAWLLSRDEWLASTRASERDRQEWRRTTAKALESQQRKDRGARSAPPPQAPRVDRKPGQDPLTGRTAYQQKLTAWMEGGCIGPRPAEGEAA